MDRKTISLKYEDLYDPITRLKETFDSFRNSSLWGQVRYENNKDGPIQYVTVFQFDPVSGRKFALGHASAPTLDEAKQQAATVALERLAARGLRRPVPEYYTKLQSMLV
jgi:dsRNA-specific ribonuclease